MGVTAGVNWECARAHELFYFTSSRLIGYYGARHVTCRRKKSPQFINRTHKFLNCSLGLTNRAHGLINRKFPIRALRFCKPYPPVITLEQGCQTQGPRAYSGPPHHFMWPARAYDCLKKKKKKKTYATLYHTL